MASLITMIFVQMHLIQQGAKANQAGHCFTLVPIWICVIVVIVFLHLWELYFYSYHNCICIISQMHKCQPSLNCICMIITIEFVWLSKLYLFGYHKWICIWVINMSIQVQIAWLWSCQQKASLKAIVACRQIILFSICMSIAIVFVHWAPFYL